MVEPNMPQMTRRMRIAGEISKATNTQSEYVIIIDFSLQKSLHERASMLRYITLPDLLNLKLFLHSSLLKAFVTFYPSVYFEIVTTDFAIEF
jgi:hypothetical protein